MGSTGAKEVKVVCIQILSTFNARLSKPERRVQGLQRVKYDIRTVWTGSASLEPTAAVEEIDGLESVFTRWSICFSQAKALKI